IGERIQLVSPIWPRKNNQPWEFEIVGILDATKKSANTSRFYFRYDYFNEKRAHGERLVGWYAVRVSDPDRAAEIAKAIDNEFTNSPYETKTEPKNTFIQSFTQQINDIDTILIKILSTVFFTILLITGKTMTQSVRERTEKLNMMKTISFTNELT